MPNTLNGGKDELSRKILAILKEQEGDSSIEEKRVRVTTGVDYKPGHVVMGPDGKYYIAGNSGWSEMPEPKRV